jgi:hypothetical protein
MKPQIIGEQEECYGYLTGLGVQPNRHDIMKRLDPTLYASFERAGQTQVWIVPDLCLFQILTKSLYSMALDGDCEDMGGTYKLLISKQNNSWIVESYVP